MDAQVFESEAKRLFGGAEIIITPYSDGNMTAFDVNITPKIDGEKRFIRVSAAHGEAMIKDYLKKIQQNLLNLQRNGAFGITKAEEPIEQSVVDKAIEEKLQVHEKPLEEFNEPVKIPKLECGKCSYSTKYPGILAIHRKKHEKENLNLNQGNKVAVATNDKDIYDAS